MKTPGELIAELPDEAIAELIKIVQEQYRLGFEAANTSYTDREVNVILARILPPMKPDYFRSLLRNRGK